MKLLLKAFAVGFIGSTTCALADTPVSPAEAEKIKAALEAVGCTGGKMEKRPRAVTTLKSMTRSAGTGSTTSSSTRTLR
jgi:hypothetical protein